MTEAVDGTEADKRLMKLLVREMGGHSVVIVRDGKRMIGWCSGKARQSIAMSDLRAIATVPAITDDDRVKQLEAEKSILLGAISFAIETDEADTFLRCFTDGRADVDDEWKDWQEFRAGLVLHGTVAKQAFPELPALTDEAISVVWTAAMTGACNIVIKRQNDLNDDDGPCDILNEQGEIISAIKKWLAPDTTYLNELRSMMPVTAITDEAVERAAKGVAERHYRHSDVTWNALGAFEKAEWKEVARAALLAAFPGKVGE